MYFATVIHFGILCTFVHDVFGDSQEEQELPMGRIRPDVSMVLKGPDGDLNQQQFEAEAAAGDNSMFMGANAHHNNPGYYSYANLGRRFVPVYPYKFEKKAKKPKKSGVNFDDLLRYIEDLQTHQPVNDYDDEESIPRKKHQTSNDDDDGPIPIKAPKDVVFTIMKKLKKTFKRRDPPQAALSQQMLRSGGDYWNDVWEEKVDPENILRSRKPRKNQKKESGPEAISATLVPGTKLYKLLGNIVKKSPKLVYIINDK